MRNAARLLLVVALLFAQTAGVTHEVWHGTSLAHADGDAKTPKGNPLCDFHTALSTVLGAVSGSSQPVVPDIQAAIAFAATDIPAAGLSGLAARSRGPPSLL